MHELLNLCQTLLGQAGRLVSPQYFLAIHRKKIFGDWNCRLEKGLGFRYQEIKNGSAASKANEQRSLVEECNLDLLFRSDFDDKYVQLLLIR
jgi:hypothetical protein